MMAFFRMREHLDVYGQEGNDHMTTMRTSEPEAPIADATRMFLVNPKQPFTHY